jgi:phosphatidylglycerophosphate synthase
MTGAPANRRPIASRDTGWARGAAQRLAAAGVTPNRISQGAIVAGAVGGLALVLAGQAGGLGRALLLVLAALACQARLVCNLLDGMVAIEGGRAERDGPFWNEAPDRVADILLLAGAGVAAGMPALGWAAAALAVATAYLRELGRAEGLPPDFSGPMAKPQRMAVLTVAVLAAVFWDMALVWGLWIIALGAGLTALRRARRMIAGLRVRAAGR